MSSVYSVISFSVLLPMSIMVMVIMWSSGSIHGMEMSILLKTVTLPASVKKVGRGAFMRCTSLTTLQVMSSSQLKQMDATALMDCPALTTVKLGNALQSMGERSLAGTGVTQLDLSSSTHLNELGDWAMVLTPVVQAKLPSSLKTVGKGAFMYDTTLDDITLGGNVPELSEYIFAGTGLESIDLSGVTQVTTSDGYLSDVSMLANSLVAGVVPFSVTCRV